jgi:DNA-binding NarL/FixJ family response regulator
VGATEAVVVGRRRELESVERFVSRSPVRPAALTISGPAGIGKTTVWQAGVEAARTNGWRVLVARPTGVEASLSFAGLLDLLATADDAQLGHLPEPQRRAVETALLREDPVGGRVDPRAVATGTSAILRELASTQPTLIAVDDAQWLDEATAEALRFALRRLDGTAVAVFCAVRSNGERPKTFETVLDDHDELELSPLSVAALHDVIRARLGHSLPRSTTVRLLQRTGGNAFYALEIARELVRHGDVEPHELPVPASVHELVRARVGRLPPETREALLLASALAVPTTSVVPADALQAAEEVGVVRIDLGGRIQFEHPLVAAAIYESAPPSRRREAHRRVVERAADAETRARHLALAAEGPDEAVAAELDGAAAHTAARGASSAAAELARLALAATPTRDREARARRSLTLARHLRDAGESAAARAALEACNPETVGGDLGATLMSELGRILWYEGDRETGNRLVGEALKQVSDPKLAARTHAAAAWLLHDEDVETAIAHTDTALSLLEPDEDPGPYSWSLLLGAYLRFVNGEGDDEDAYRRGCKLQQRQIDWEDSSPVVGMWPLLHDRFDEAREHYERGLENARAAGDVTSILATLFRLAEIACWTGAWGEADQRAEEGVALADRLGSTAYLGSAHYARGLVDAHLGRLDEARASGERIVETFGSDFQGSLGHWVLGFVALSTGDAAVADEQYSRAQAVIDAQGLREPARFRFQPDHLEAVVQLGQLRRAREMLAGLERRAATSPRPWTLATGARCRAVVLSAEGDQAEAANAAAEALRHHERLDMPFERARTLLVQGRILRRLKQKRDARLALDEAAAIFAGLGAASWTATASAELRRVATRRAPSQLTPTERRVAELAATGLSNPEIATRLYLSRKTVEANLGRVYRKLGISSRAQLGRVLDRDAPVIS